MVDGGVVLNQYLRILLQNIPRLPSLQQLKNSPSTGSHPTKANCNNDPLSVWRTTLDAFFEWVQASLSSNPDKNYTTAPTCLIPSPQSLPLREVFYGPPPAEAAILRRRFDPPLQRSIHQALFNPAVHLKVCYGLQFHGYFPSSLSIPSVNLIGSGLV